MLWLVLSTVVVAAILFFWRDRPRNIFPVMPEADHMLRPELKQFEQLTEADFDRYPVWIDVHLTDYSEPWYDETDEQTCRPWTGDIPVDPAQHMFFIRAAFEMSDGSQHSGFATPSARNEDLGAMQPVLFAGGRQHLFWWGILGINDEHRRAFYTAVGKEPELIFPIDFQIPRKLSTGALGGQIAGFYRMKGDQLLIER